MPTLSTRLVKQARKSYRCDWCYGPIRAGYVRLYGMAYADEKPGTFRYHYDCTENMPDARAAVQQAESDAQKGGA